MHTLAGACRLSCSLEEEAVGAVDAGDQVSKTRSTKHHVFLNHWDRSVIVSGRGSLASDEPRIDVFDGKVVAIVGPSGVVLRLDGCRRNWILRGHRAGGRCVPVPVSGAERHGRVTRVKIDHRVPDRVEVGHTIYAWHFLQVAALVTLGVGGVDFGLGVERLMEVANIMNHKAECER